MVRVSHEAMSNSLRYFMWGYQQHFVGSFEYKLKEILERLGLQSEGARFCAIGVLAPTESNPNRVCISPEETTTDLTSYQQLPSRVEAIYANHPNQQILYGDAPSMSDKPEAIRCDSVKLAILEFLQPLDVPNGVTSFAGMAVQVGPYYVVPVIQLGAAHTHGDHVLSVAISCGGYKGEASLVHAAIRLLLAEATAELKRSDPGRYLTDRGLATDEILRRAGRSFMSTPALALGELYSAGGFADAINEISSLLYERKQGQGLMLLGRSDDSAIEFDLQFAKPIPLANARWSRKILEMGNAEMPLVASSEGIWGLGRRVPVTDNSTQIDFRIEFLGQHRWRLSADSKPIVQFDFGTPSIPRRKLSTEAFAANFQRAFPGATDDEAQRAAALFETADKLGHGAMLVYSHDAATEAIRLSGEGTRTIPSRMTPDVLRRVSGIDGTILLDIGSDCHAIGVILDGKAHPECDPARGSRYNSAIRYSYGDKGRLAIVVSDDGMLDVMPKPMPRISRRSVHAAIKALEGANKDNYHKIREWLSERSFYLDAANCQRVNLALERIMAEPRALGEVSISESPFQPNDRLDSSYFLEEDSEET